MRRFRVTLEIDVDDVALFRVTLEIDVDDVALSRVSTPPTEASVVRTVLLGFDHQTSLVRECYAIVSTNCEEKKS